jgi:hypothetical protein
VGGDSQIKEGLSSKGGVPGVPGEEKSIKAEGRRQNAEKKAQRAQKSGFDWISRMDRILNALD